MNPLNSVMFFGDGHSKIALIFSMCTFNPYFPIIFPIYNSYFISLKQKIRVVKHPKEIETLLHKYEKFSEFFHMVDHLIGGLSITLFWRRVFHPFRYQLIFIPIISYMRLKIPSKI